MCIACHSLMPVRGSTIGSVSVTASNRKDTPPRTTTRILWLWIMSTLRHLGRADGTAHSSISTTAFLLHRRTHDPSRVQTTRRLGCRSCRLFVTSAVQRRLALAYLYIQQPSSSTEGHAIRPESQRGTSRESMVMTSWGDSPRTRRTRDRAAQRGQQREEQVSGVDDDGQLGRLTAGPVSQEIGQMGTSRYIGI